MEQFKVCEKETKTKTYAKEGMGRVEKRNPEDQAKIDTYKWVGKTIKRIQQLVEVSGFKYARCLAPRAHGTNGHYTTEGFRRSEYAGFNSELLVPP